MDPNETLKRMLALANRLQRNDPDTDFEAAAEDMSGHFLNLDEWLTKGGFLPERWVR